MSDFMNLIFIVIFYFMAVFPNFLFLDSAGAKPRLWYRITCFIPMLTIILGTFLAAEPKLIKYFDKELEL